MFPTIEQFALGVGPVSERKQAAGKAQLHCARAINGNQRISLLYPFTPARTFMVQARLMKVLKRLVLQQAAIGVGPGLRTYDDGVATGDATVKTLRVRPLSKTRHFFFAGGSKRGGRLTYFVLGRVDRRIASR